MSNSHLSRFPSRADLTPQQQTEIIKRSTRCFAFGALGLIPLLGLPLCCLAFRLSRQLGEPTGDRFRIGFTVFFVLLGMALSIVLQQPLLAAPWTILVFEIHTLVLWGQYFRRSPETWNPARHMVYLGVTLAWIGCLVPLTAAITIVLLIIDHLNG